MNIKDLANNAKSFFVSFSEVVFASKDLRGYRCCLLSWIPHGYYGESFLEQSDQTETVTRTETNFLMRLLYFPVMKYLTILPKRVIPKMIPITIARMIAKNRVSLKKRKKSGTKTMQRIIVRQPVAKSLVSNIGIPSCVSILENPCPIIHI